MENRASKPDWDTADKPNSLKAHAEWLHRDPIMRDGDTVKLEEGIVLGREKCLNLESFFGYP